MNEVSSRRRMMAQIIDLFILVIIGLIIYLTCPKINSLFHYLSGFYKMLLYSQILGFFYYFFFYYFSNGLSLGRIITKQRIISKDGTMMNVGQILCRSITQTIIILLIINALYQFFYKTRDSIFAGASNTTCVNITK